MCLSPGAAGTKCHRPGRLKRQSILSQFQRPQVGNPGITRAVLPPEALGEAPSSPLRGFRRELVIRGVPWPAAAWLRRLFRVHVAPSFVCCLYVPVRVLLSFLS